MKLNVNKFKHSERFDLQRRVVSHITTSSWQNIPHISYIYEPDITDFYNEFKILVDEKRNLECKPSFNTIMLKVITEGLLSAPDLNSYVEYNHRKTEGMTHMFEEINISIPWLLPNGKMITPTIPKVEKMSLRDISAYVSNISKRIENTNIDEMLYRAVSKDTVNELKKFNLSILRRVLATKVSLNRIKGINGKEKETYYKIPENERLTERDIRSGTVTVSNIGSLYKEQKASLVCLKSYHPKLLQLELVRFRKNQECIYIRMEIRKLV
jgi:hypothetical protein